MVLRLYVEKRPPFAVEARSLKNELKNYLGIEGLSDLRIINRYDVEGLEENLFEKCIPTVLSEPAVDTVYRSLDEVLSKDALGDALVGGLTGGSSLSAGGSLNAGGSSLNAGGSLNAGAGAQQGTNIHFFAVEFLRGQFDQRADSAAECMQLISQKERPLVRSAKLYVLAGALDSQAIAKIKHYVINPIEAQEAAFELPKTLKQEQQAQEKIPVIENFSQLDDEKLSDLQEQLGLAMDLADLKVCQAYFLSEKRDPTLTEIRVIDTYWSDHCRHTTFSTQLKNIEIKDDLVKASFDRYLELRDKLGRADSPRCLMDIATIGARWLKHEGKLDGLDESEEINACTVKITCDVDGEDQDWLFYFKNETHNHPTEIEPFGGAATCIGGAIRDPLSGRSYVYQAMRITGAANPLAPLEQTMPHKLPQRKICLGAAEGYSSYGNQIGLATGQVHELYHPGYLAKRLEVGAVVGAAPQDHVKREEPRVGDVVVLLGGRTGRDGIGGATGSSKAQKETSLETCAAEVQKGNAPTERKLQRLFRSKEASELIKRCNDFGAGGVAVAVGELARGLRIDLDRVPLKYEGLSGTEIAISESQERMAVVLAKKDLKRFLELAAAENLEATQIASVSDDPYLKMYWKKHCIVRLSREFLASNGAQKEADVLLAAPGADTEHADEKLPGASAVSAVDEADAPGAVDAESAADAEGAVDEADAHSPASTERAETTDAEPANTEDATSTNDEDSAQSHEAQDDFSDPEAFSKKLIEHVSCLNLSSQKGLAERFDSTIGTASVLLPFGGRRQLTPANAMVALLPVDGKTTTVSGMSWGFNPYLCEYDQFAGAFCAVVESVTKLVASGFKRRDMYLSFQEYFGKLKDQATRWGKPFACLLGALTAQLDLEIAAIGGKDSMSGSYNELDVPPSFISFAAATGTAQTICSPEFKSAGSRLILLRPKLDKSGRIPSSEALKAEFSLLEELLEQRRVKSVLCTGMGGLIQSLFESCTGNQLGVSLKNLHESELFEPRYGSVVLELDADFSQDDFSSYLGRLVPKECGLVIKEIGKTTANYELELPGGASLELEPIQEAWEAGLEGIYNYRRTSANAAFTLPSASQARGTAQKAAVRVPLAKTAEVSTHRSLPVLAKPRAIIPVFPGTNCEYDSARAFECAGAKAEVLVINNLSPEAILDSTKKLARAIRNSQIIMLPGGFSGADEPDGSAKLICALFRSTPVSEAVHDLLDQRDGLILGVCNGFQALIKLGLIPFGRICDMTRDCATLTSNQIGRHQSMLVRTRVTSKLSPWMSKCELGDIHTIAISHGEGRLSAPPEVLKNLMASGQIAAQYVDDEGLPTMALPYNPNGSDLAIEALTSPDGRILGKMGHSERSGKFLYKNYPELAFQPIFESGVSYFTD